MIVRRIRAALRSPFYRAEKRQAGVARGLLWVLALTLAAPLSVFSCLMMIFMPLLLTLPAWMAAEGLLTEMDRDTLDGLLLTPAGREDILWAKLLARLRPVFWFSAALPVIGAVLGAFIGAIDIAFPDEGTIVGGLAIGGGIGLLVGLLGVGQGFTSGAFGVAAVLLARSRTRAYLLAGLFCFAQFMAEFMVACGIVVVWVIGGVITSFGPYAHEPPVWFFILLVLFGVAMLVGHVILINRLLPKWVLGWAARRMDHRLLQNA